MARPNWEYIRIDVLLPEHPKTDGLSALAKWTLVELWCYCGRNRTDGFVSEARWKSFGNETVRAQLLRVPSGYKHGFVEQVQDGYQVHDFVGPDGHQRSRAEIDELSASVPPQAGRVEAATAGAANPKHLLDRLLDRCLTATQANRQALA